MAAAVGGGGGRQREPLVVKLTQRPKNSAGRGGSVHPPGCGRAGPSVFPQRPRFGFSSRKGPETRLGNFGSAPYGAPRRT